MLMILKLPQFILQYFKLEKKLYINYANIENLREYKLTFTHSMDKCIICLPYNRNGFCHSS